MVDEHKTRDAFGCSSGRARSRAFGPDNCCDSADDSTSLLPNPHRPSRLPTSQHRYDTWSTPFTIEHIQRKCNVGLMLQLYRRFRPRTPFQYTARSTRASEQVLLARIRPFPWLAETSATVRLINALSRRLSPPPHCQHSGTS